jgi:FAD/FMN-containing dehydrogenase
MGKGIVIIDPKRMDKILKIDRNNMYAVIEPYVSFANLQAEAMKVGCTMPTPPAGAQVSALANIQWHGAYGTSWVAALGAQQLLSFEVVLPNGEILRSGSIAPRCTVRARRRHGDGHQDFNETFPLDRAFSFSHTGKRGRKGILLPPR